MCGYVLSEPRHQIMRAFKGNRVQYPQVVRSKQPSTLIGEESGSTPVPWCGDETKYSVPSKSEIPFLQPNASPLLLVLNCPAPVFSDLSFGGCVLIVAQYILDTSRDSRNCTQGPRSSRHCIQASSEPGQSYGTAYRGGSDVHKFNDVTKGSYFLYAPWTARRHHGSRVPHLSGTRMERWARISEEWESGGTLHQNRVWLQKLQGFVFMHCGNFVPTSHKTRCVFACYELRGKNKTEHICNNEKIIHMCISSRYVAGNLSQTVGSALSFYYLSLIIHHSSR
jgi:hypothetical protein